MEKIRKITAIIICLAVSGFGGFAARADEHAHGETWKLYYKGPHTEIEKIDEAETPPDDWTALPYYDSEKHDRYIKYKNAHEDFTYEQVVTFVNIGLDKGFYSDTSQAENLESELVLVNKYSSLPKDYVPEGYEASDTRVLRLRNDAQEFFEQMKSDAADDGISIYIVSGYRSYSVQNSIYQERRRLYPSSVDRYTARPGFSEHQTGLAADLNTANTSYGFQYRKEYKWLCENAHKYGFILRYPEGKTWITGIAFEPWHWRYVGVEAAEIIKEQNITFDEYCAKLEC